VLGVMESGGEQVVSGIRAVLDLPRTFSPCFPSKQAVAHAYVSATCARSDKTHADGRLRLVVALLREGELEPLPRWHTSSRALSPPQPGHSK
jgi:hypothetical protein